MKVEKRTNKAGWQNRSQAPLTTAMETVFLIEAWLLHYSATFSGGL
jgi:hypothetical protein